MCGLFQPSDSLLISYWLPIVCQPGFSVPVVSEAGNVPVAAAGTAAVLVLVSAKSLCFNDPSR